MPPTSAVSIPPRIGLRAGDWVVVRSKPEILATLDRNGCLDGLPFQPEMFAFAGRRMQVAKVAHKTCDNIRKTGSRGRRMLNAVHLVGGRCDGSSHGGCQADCVFFWKESWLRRETDPPAEGVAGECQEDDVLRSVCAPDTAAGQPDGPTWVCQTTKLYDATGPLAWWDVRQYWKDVATGNHAAWDMVKLLLFAGYRKFVRFGPGYRYKLAFFNWFQSLRGGKPFPVMNGVIADGQPTPTATLDLQPGEWIEIRSPEDIARTLTASGFNRGMRYDLEMVKYSGGRYRVERRVDRLINEQTGKMMTMKNPCIQLEDVYCRAECTDTRLGCPRASNTYWREIWLKRVDPL